MCGKCENWIIGVLGLFVSAMPFLGFDPNLHKILMVVTGLVIAALGFWGALTGLKKAAV